MRVRVYDSFTSLVGRKRFMSYGSRSGSTRTARATSYNTYVYLHYGNNARITTTIVICKGPRLPRIFFFFLLF